MVMVKTTDGSSYTGLTSAAVNGKRYPYAANFNKGTVDVYDNVVTYALLEEHETAATTGPGLGFLDIFSPDGRLLQRLEHEIG
jgi:hypothetical protein